MPYSSLNFMNLLYFTIVIILLGAVVCRVNAMIKELYQKIETEFPELVNTGN